MSNSGCKLTLSVLVQEELSRADLQAQLQAARGDHTAAVIP